MKTFSLNKIIAIFALLFLIGGGKILARNGQPQTLPITNYSPNGSKFYSDFTIDWTTQKLQIIVDVTNCTRDASGNNPDDVFDLCPQTTSDVGWNSPTPVVHVYCDGTQLNLHGNKFTGKNDLSPTVTLGSSYDKTNITIEIDNENGLTVDGNSTTLTATFLTELLNNSNLTFASQEGSGRMHGTYKSVKVVSKNKAVITNKSWDEGSIVNSLCTNYQGNGTQFIKETAIDWTKQKVVAEIDISTCGTGTEDLFSIGEDILTFKANNIHMYKTTGGISAYVAGNHVGGGITSFGPSPFDGNILRVELSSEKGFVVNDVVIFSKEVINQYSEQYYSKQFFSLSNIQVGSGEGTNQESRAKYNYISVATKDYQTATEKSSNVLNEVTINEFVAQSNVDVQLKRSLTPAQWNTFCVPFAISADVIAEKFGAGTLVYTFGSMNGNVMNFTASTTIEAGQPYIVKPTNTVVNPTFTGVNIEATAAKKVGADGYFMQGIYSAKIDLTTDGTNLFLGDGNKFYKPAGTTTARMKGLRAFFIVPQGTNLAALRANIDGATTAIDELATVVEQPTDNRIYNLQGQFVGTSFEGLHGVYVQNGKKVLVK